MKSIRTVFFAAVLLAGMVLAYADNANAKQRIVLDGTEQSITVDADANIIGTGAAETLNIEPGVNVSFTAGDGDRVNLPHNLEDYIITSSGNQILFEGSDGYQITLSVNGTSTVGFANGNATLEMAFQPGEMPYVGLGGAKVDRDPLEQGQILLEDPTNTVTFEDYDGTILESQTVNHGSSATAPADPTREGCTFTGWDVSFDNVTEDIMVTAQYTINSPDNLAADAGDQQVGLTWDTMEGATGYYLYYGPYDDIHPSHGNSYDELIDLGDVSRYTVEGLENDTIYFFVLTADVPGSESGPSNVVSATPGEYAAEITNSLDMKFVYIEPGTFMMGSPEDEPGRRDDETQHQVTLTQGYYMQTTSVTQGQWEAVMGDNPSYFFDCGDDCPVESVSWYDAQEFITALNQQEGTTGYELPTEAQWEYAARAGSPTAFANGPITETGDGYDPVLDSMGWYTYNSHADHSPLSSGKGTHPVAQKDPNDWELYDMHGNVREWVADWYGDYPISAVTDPTGPSEGTARVLRSGRWISHAKYCRSASRGYISGDSDSFFGFRLVLLPGH